MLASNNPAVSRVTRRYVQGLVADGALDADCARLLHTALALTEGLHPGGLVLRLALHFGARPEAAFEVASFAELFYALASLTDDLQDGDGERDLPQLSPALRLNVLAQLWCVTAARGAALASSLGAQGAVEQLDASFRAGAAMLCGQRLELQRDGWSADAWRRVAELSAGRQLEVYLRLAAASTGRQPPRALIALAVPLGVLTQLRQDRDDGDPRLLALPAADVERIEQDALAAVREAASALPPDLADVLRAQFDRVGATPVWRGGDADAVRQEVSV